MCGKRITEIIRGKRKALKSNDFKAFFVETVGFEPMTSTLPV